jgi:hypothetical protein
LPTFDFECPQGHTFEVRGCAVGQREHECPEHGVTATRVFLPGAWTTPRVGIFQERYDWELGGRVSSKRQQLELARKRGLVRKEDVVVRGLRPMPTLDEAERALQELEPSRVARAREKREKIEYEERSGLRPPSPGE